MFPIVISGLVGAPLAVVAFWNHGIADALVAAPLGGSLAALVTALYLGTRRDRPARARAVRMTPPRARFATTWHAAAHGAGPRGAAFRLR